jgi:pimeloyl-ACP methyl ester carboxylesterase
MRKSTIAALTLVAAAALVVGSGAAAQGQDTRSRGHGHYADVNGLHMYYEVHGKRKGQPPLVLVHGALSATGTSFGQLLPTLAKSRQVISIEQQAHGHTADNGRPLSVGQMAEDTVALLRQIGVERADFFGYSMGAGVALDIGIRHPDVVRKLVLAAVSYTPEGVHPGVLDGVQSLRPEDLFGSPFHEEYLRIAPRPQDFPILVERVKDMTAHLPSLSPETVRAMRAPTMILLGDSDIVRPEHAVEMFRLLGGGVLGDAAGLPNSQLAVVPGATHVSLMNRPEVLLPIIPAFLDAPVR